MNKKLLDTLTRKYGEKVALASRTREMNSIPTGILSLDLALGSGGWKKGSVYSVFGGRDVGKSAAIGLGAARQAQKLGYAVVWIAVEPDVDEAWCRKLGVDPDEMIIQWPDNGEEAFRMTRDAVEAGADLVIFDSIGMLLSESELEPGGKAKFGGQSGIVTTGVKAIAPRAYKTNSCVIFLNQIRDDANSTYDLQKQPGGYALEHASEAIIRLKPRKTEKEGSGDNQIVVGHEIVAIIERNKSNEGSKQRSIFKFWQVGSQEHSVGVDVLDDTISTALKTGVIGLAGSMYSLPNVEKAIKGRLAVETYLKSHPDMVEIIHAEVLAKIVSR